MGAFEVQLACDFETTVYRGQDHTEVWASACVEFGTEEVHIFHSIDEQFKYFKTYTDRNINVTAYYHNLKFDGSFWLDYLLNTLGYAQAYTELNEDGTSVEWLRDKDMPDKSFKYMISDKGQWYTLTIKLGRRTIQLRDSVKLLPFTLAQIGKAFKTKHQKLDMEYTGYRYAGCVITEDEQRYIENDVLVLKEALEFMYSENHTKLTIGSCCLEEYKRIIGERKYENMFPDFQQMQYECIIVDGSGNNIIKKYDNVDKWVRKSYRGGWCYLVKGKENTVFHNGTTADVNSLYPSMMSSESGNYYPVGEPTFWCGDYIPEEALINNRYYFVHFKTRFQLKEGYLPFVQIKDSLYYSPTEMLETSDIIDPKTGTRYTHRYDFDGTVIPNRVELTMTMTDYALLQEHYNLTEFEIIDGCWFESKIGIFDEYIEKYKKIKLESTGAMRQLAKLFLNNLYGKMASSSNSSFKLAYTKEDGTIGFIDVYEDKKKMGYIPVGSAITSYARNFTIRTRQKNYYGKDKRGFIYADTDSIHCDLAPEELKDVPVHDKNFCCWKLESNWDEAIFVRQKTYIEHIVAQDLVPIDSPYYEVKCAGMPQKCKDNFLSTMNDLTDFKLGLTVGGKLVPKRIKGGVLLVETDYTMR